MALDRDFMARMIAGHRTDSFNVTPTKIDFEIADKMITVYNNEIGGPWRVSYFNQEIFLTTAEYRALWEALSRAEQTRDQGSVKVLLDGYLERETARRDEDFDGSSMDMECGH